MVAVNVYVLYATVYYSSQPEAVLEAPPKVPSSSETCSVVLHDESFASRERLGADVFGFPESIVSLGKAQLYSRVMLHCRFSLATRLTSA